VLLNNAGVMLGSICDLTPIEIYRKSMEVNYFGMVNVCKTFLPLLKLRARRGSEGVRIVNLASICGRFSGHSSGAYSASKFAVEAFTTALRQEMREWNIQVTMLEPGYHGTYLLPLFTKNLTSCFESAPKEIQEEYGIEFVAAQTKTFDFFKHLMCSDAKRVVDVICSACLTSKVSPRYVIGMDAQYVFGPASTFLPDWLFDSILLKATGLPKPKALLPAA